MEKKSLVQALLTLAILCMLFIAASSASAQSGQPWDDSFDKPAKLTTLTLDYKVTNLQACQVARSMKRRGALTAKGKREACKANRIDNRAAFWAAFYVGMVTAPRYPYYYYYGL